MTDETLSTRRLTLALAAPVAHICLWEDDEAAWMCEECMGCTRCCACPEDYDLQTVRGVLHLV